MGIGQREELISGANVGHSTVTMGSLWRSCAKVRGLSKLRLGVARVKSVDAAFSQITLGNLVKLTYLLSIIHDNGKITAERRDIRHSVLVI